MPPRTSSLPPFLRRAAQPQTQHQLLSHPQTLPPAAHLLKLPPSAARPISSLPTFPPSTSEPLNDLLTRFRTNILLPSTLNRVQRDLIYKRRNHPNLLSNPLTITVGDEEFTLKPLDRTQDEPALVKLFTEVMRGVQETGEWGIVRPFLGSLVIAKRRLRGEQKAKVVRVMGEGGAFAELAGCLQDCAHTNLKMGEWTVAREVVYALGRAVASGDREKAKHFCDEIWAELFRERQGAEETKRRIEMIGAVMLVRAASGDAEEVGRLARMVAKYWPEDGEAYVRENKEQAPDQSQYPIEIVPMARGLRLAAEVMGDTEEGRYIAERAAEAEGWVEGLVREVEEGTPEGRSPRRAVQLYYELKEVGLPEK